MEHGFAKFSKGPENFSIKLMSVTAGRAQFGPPGYECDLLYLACLAGLVFGGSGPMAVDDYLREKF
jgi:putative oxidoreductase